LLVIAGLDGTFLSVNPAQAAEQRRLK